MFYVYLLKSRKDGKCYLGSTKHLERRLVEHNEGLVPSTKSRAPFEVVYYEAYKAEGDARMRESRLKLRSKAFTQLRTRLVESLGLETEEARPHIKFGSGSDAE